MKRRMEYNLKKKKKIFIPEQVTVNENIDYSNFHIGDKVAELFYKSYKNSSDDEGESIEDWKLILNDFMNGNCTAPKILDTRLEVQFLWAN